MKVLVAYASRHGATKGIAERVATELGRRGFEVTVRTARSAKDVHEYDAFVVGGAAYAFHWLGDASKFVRHNSEILASSPTWLFSCGPLGTDKVDAKTGKDVKESATPREFAEFQEEINPRDEHVFFGAWDPEAPAIGWMEHVMHALPAARKAMPAGDFRDWPEIDAWARQIGNQLEAEA